MNPTELSLIIDKIYAAALEPTRWREVSLAIQSSIGAHTVNFAIEDTQNKEYQFLFTNGATHSQIEYYCKNIMAHDDLTNYFNEKTTGLAFLTQEEWDLDQLNSFFAYQEFYKDIGSTYFIGGEFFRSEDSRAYVSIARSHLDELFTKENQKALQLLLPHLNRALFIGLKLLEKDQKINTLKDSLDHLSSAIILLNDKGCVYHANVHAEPYLLSNNWNKGAYPIELSDHKANRYVQAGVRRILSTQKFCEPCCTYFIKEGIKHSVVAIPWNRDFNAHEWVGDAAKCLIIITNTTVESIDTCLLRSMCGLSKAEAKVMKEYLSGKAARDIAHELCVCEATIRFHVRAILLKTQSKSMLEASVKILRTLSIPIF